MDDAEEMPPLEEETASSLHKETQDKNNSQVRNNLDSITIDKIEDEEDEDDEEEEEEEEKDWVEMDAESSTQLTQTLCLFCEDVFDSPCSLFYHMEVKHQFSIRSMACHWSFDQLTYIKYVNYIRKEKPKAPFALSLKPQTWQKDEYMKPIISNDPLLMFGKIFKKISLVLFLYYESQILKIWLLNKKNDYSL